MEDKGMNITFNRDNEIPYGDLDIGDVFSCGGSVYMLTDQPEEDMEGELKSVNLANGNMEIFGTKVMVTRFDNATCILK